ncbi:MAG: hypothetical protein EOS36_12005 [Mesorhizobium sp.]|uniref:hypothetical protein n=1 Tax=Mesorhizobium sp. TaxID=1871066 RepID=UPI000FE7277A|nr:hypothetical protein [Mesorhizobium sp.]RWD63619.1 MAG: hypothetical protein EOS36_12005 [Mesorhizobium sp.]RWE41845.1 MAG: hypothetical protein EOS79_16905 [Mesorhizobium sp.]
MTYINRMAGKRPWAAMAGSGCFAIIWLASRPSICAQTEPFGRKYQAASTASALQGYAPFALKVGCSHRIVRACDVLLPVKNHRGDRLVP